MAAASKRKRSTSSASSDTPAEADEPTKAQQALIDGDKDAVEKNRKEAEKHDVAGERRDRRYDPIHMDQFAARHGADLLQGHFVTITKGEHEGVKGVFESVVEADENGYPKVILVVPRHSARSRITVDAADVVNSDEAVVGRR